ncbi:MAG: DEAD/DEAH box helicase [Gammaproteobacteria bacterium]|nr:DEAD/DEAH box helicase [Gammaproteobacteria bacterium]
MTTSTPIITFDKLGLNPKLLPSLANQGYELPTHIQAECIPIMLSGRDLLGQASTGTGKTAAFALPILSNLDENQIPPQALILTPTRELALQVSEAFQTYAKNAIKDFHVLPVYGGTDYRGQLQALKRGVHVVVGTPGRILDHLNRGTLVLSQLKTVVLDEADEMLNMGFLEDVKTILSKITIPHQVALFSATMPASLRSIVNEHLKDPAKIHVKQSSASKVNIDQGYMVVSHQHKLEALTRYLEVEDIEGVLIFTRTKIGSEEVANKLEARGYAVSALNGDMPQSARENVIRKIKNGSLDIIVATEVAARGLDVERINHVINYDIPQDIESYTHRIGRTGRAGRTGKAMLFVSPRETRMLRAIENSSASPLKELQPPTTSQINKKRADVLSLEIGKILANTSLDYYRELVKRLAHDHECSETDIAAAFASLSGKANPASAKSQETFVEKSDQPRDRNNGRPSNFKRSFNDKRPDKKRRFGEGNDRDANKKRGNAENKPRNAESRPRNAESRPRNAEDRPRNAENRPRNAESRPRNAENRPRNAESRPRNAEDRPRNAENRPLFKKKLSTNR